MRLIQLLLGLLVVAVAILGWQMKQLADAQAGAQPHIGSSTLEAPSRSENLPSQHHKIPIEYEDLESLVESIRVIVREELASQRTVAVGESARIQQPPAVDDADEALTEMERQAHWQNFEHALRHYRTVGEMNNSEVAELEQLIARLHPEDRRTALNQFNDAISSGAVNARL